MLLDLDLAVQNRFFFAHAKLGAYRNDFSCNCVKTTVVLFHLTCYHVRKSKDLNV